MRYALMRSMDITNGEGVGVSLFVQGCPFHCKGCFNQETWDFNGGYEWTSEVEEKFLGLADHSYIKRISILGGEPLAPQNRKGVAELLRDVRQRFPDKKVWLYTGFKWEEISYVNSFVDCLQYVDVLVDGQFELDKQDLFNERIVFAGSYNQRIIDVQQSLQTGKIIPYK